MIKPRLYYLLIIKNRTSLVLFFLNPLVFLLSIFASNISADDSLSALMQRMKSDSAVKIAYQETRTLELMDQPWLGSGYMYSMPSGLMLREQLKPQRLLMGIDNSKMYYYSPEDKIRYQGELEDDPKLKLNFSVFKALISADQALLKRIYQVDFSLKPKRWVMTLKPKKKAESGFKIIVSGLLEDKVDTIIIKQEDDDLSEFMLNTDNNSTDNEIKQTINQLYSELVGL